MPEYVWAIKVRRQRMHEITNAVRRYDEVNAPIPSQWMAEYERLNNEEKKFRSENPTFSKEESISPPSRP